jgi:hypothetical protein
MTHYTQLACYRQVSVEPFSKVSFDLCAIIILICYINISEWYWKCVLHGYALKLAAVVAGLLSAAVVWSEVTFFNKEPVLSLFAQFLNLAKVNYDYLTIEVIANTVKPVLFLKGLQKIKR